MVSGLLPAQWALDPPPSQLRQQKDYAPPPLRRQRLPNALATGVAHDAIQASAQPRGALCSQESATRSIPSTNKRHLLWDIELFFRAMKQTLKITSFLGRSENAVRVQVAVALIAFLLLSRLRELTKETLSFLQLARLVRANLMHRKDVTRLRRAPPPNPFDSRQLQFDWSCT